MEVLLCVIVVSFSRRWWWCERARIYGSVVVCDSGEW